MNDILFKLTDPITLGTVAQFEAEHNFKPAKGSDLTSLDWAWGGLEPVPNVTSAQAVDRDNPVLDGAFVRVGYTVRDKTPEELFNELPFKTLDEAQFALAEWINKLTYQIEGKYPAVIQKGWDDEEAMAVAYKTETETEAQLEILQRLAAKKGRTMNEHVNRVLYLAGTFHTIKTIVHELWLETDAKLEAAETPHEYEAIFDAAKAKAAPAAAYGLSA